MPYVGDAEVVSHFSVKNLVLKATTKANTAIETLEIIFTECLICLSVAIVLDSSAYSPCHVTAGKWVNAEVAVYIKFIFYDYRNFKIVKVVNKFLALVLAFAALLCIEQP